MKKRILSLALALTLILALVPLASASAAAGTYNTNDIAVVNAIIADNGLQWTPAPEDGSAVPSDWNDRVYWTSGTQTNRRIYSLLVEESGLTGALDVSGLTELTILYCGANQLTALDVSKNTELTDLRCYGNQLTSLDLSKNTALEWLICRDNQLTSLDVSNNAALTSLICIGNRLEELNVSKNTALIELNCWNNQLTELDVRMSTELTLLNCDQNLLTELDVSRNTKLKNLMCRENPITVLDVSKNIALIELNCAITPLSSLDVSRNTELASLECWRTPLSSLDTSANSKLTKLWCFENKLTELDVSRNNELTELWCRENQLTTLDVSKNTKLTDLRCENNYLPDKAAIIGLDEKMTTVTFDPQRTPEPVTAPNLDTADSWAVDGINEAYAKGFVPADLQGNYKNIITRQEFCRMAVMYVEYKTGKTIDAVLTEQGKTLNPNAFSDTSDPDILAAYALGITNGTKAPAGTNPGTFTPNGAFSREQAAAMIMNTCKIMGMDVSNLPAAGFIDMNTASAWAVDGINFVRAKGIMSGTSTDASNPTFNPKGTYTRQESLVSFDRIQ